MDPHVGPQGGLLAKGLATGVTDEGFVSSGLIDMLLSMFLGRIFPGLEVISQT